jgi:hypothetical protein
MFLIDCFFTGTGKRITDKKMKRKREKENEEVDRGKKKARFTIKKGRQDQRSKEIDWSLNPKKYSPAT